MSVQVGAVPSTWVVVISTGQVISVKNEYEQVNDWLGCFRQQKRNFGVSLQHTFQKKWQISGDYPKTVGEGAVVILISGRIER